MELFDLQVEGRKEDHHAFIQDSWVHWTGSSRYQESDLLIWTVKIFPPKSEIWRKVKVQIMTLLTAASCCYWLIGEIILQLYTRVSVSDSHFSDDHSSCCSHITSVFPSQSGFHQWGWGVHSLPSPQPVWQSHRKRAGRIQEHGGEKATGPRRYRQPIHSEISDI